LYRERLIVYWEWEEVLLRTDSPFLRAVICLVLILLCILSNVPSETSSPATANSIARPLTTTFNNVNFDQQVPRVPGGTYRNFDQTNAGTQYVEGIHAQPPAPQIMEGEPLEMGNFMRLSSVTPISMPVQNSIAFARTAPGAFDLVVADFDFRLTPPRGQSVGVGRADGFGFALLNTAVVTHGIAGAVAPQAPLFSLASGLIFTGRPIQMVLN
jgi:hypothetical protein